MNFEGGPIGRTAEMWTTYQMETGSGSIKRQGVDPKDPFDPKQQAILLDKSPTFHADKVRSSVLLLYGARSFLESVGVPLYTQYQHFHVPSQLIVYDERHAFEKPASISDSITRAIDWIDRWTNRPVD